MKINVVYWLLLSISVILFGCSNDEEINRDFTFIGTVIDASSKEPMPELPVVVTDGNNIHTSAKTNADGRFMLTVNINEISSAYYILIGDDSCIKKTVEIHGFSGGETNLGTIEIIGPSIPSVRLNGHKTDNGIITCNASITANGRLEVIEKGFCFGKTAQPTIDDEKIVCGSGGGSFQGKITITDLDVSSTYFIRPYATNAKGTGYGEEFSTSTEDGLPSIESLGAGSIKATSASLGGRLISNGGYEVTERGVCWDKDGTPSVEDNYKFIDGQETINFWIDVDGLSPNTKYYMRAYAKNKHGIAYGSIESFTTKDGLPSVETTQVKYGTTILECYGNVTKDGGFPIIRRGFCYSTHSQPTLDDKFELSTSNIVGEYCLTIDNLEEGTKYHVRAFVENEKGISYGDVEPATTMVTTTFRVVDTYNTPIPDATIYFGSTSTSYKCDNNGQLQLTNSVGTWNTFWASADGYNDSEKFRDKPISKYNKEYTITLSKKIPVSLNGVVVDDDGIPLKDVKIEIYKDDYYITTTSNDAGYYSFENIAFEGSCQMKLRKDNYQISYVSLSLAQGDNKSNVEMNITHPFSINGQYNTHISKRYESYSSGLEGTTVSKTMVLKNRRQINVEWRITGVPSKGLKLSMTSGVLKPGESVDIISEFTYPGPNVPGSTVHKVSYVQNGVTYTKIYLWPWTVSEAHVYTNGSCSGYCGQDMNVQIGSCNIILSYWYESNVIWR